MSSIQSRAAALAALCLGLALCSSANAATDRKTVHGTICQPENPSDAAKLRYMGRGLHANGADVDLVCPLVRDSTQSRLQSVVVSFQRGVGSEVVQFNLSESQDRKFKDQFRIELLSCSDRDIGNACASSGHHFGSNTGNPSHPTISDFSGIPMDAERSFAIKTRLPKGTVLKSLTYTEKVQ